MSSETQVATGIRVRIAPDREIPISREIAEKLRKQAVAKFSEVIEEVQAHWNNAERGVHEGRTPTEQDRENIGGIFWMLGECRESLNDYIYLTDPGKTFGEGESSRLSSRGDPASHEFGGQGSQR